MSPPEQDTAPLLMCLLPWLLICADEWDQWQPSDEMSCDEREFNVS